ncbi:MAG: response regulator [Candidatus Omnitrophica bacterium]|nr:response regulator [Candidatus Omnitrophota bacterium]
MPKKILVVDDDVEMTMMVQTILEEKDYEVFLAHSGLDAIEKSNQEALDLILLDIRMPTLSGFWFCDAFKKRPHTSNIPVVIVSSLSAEEDIAKAYQLGATAYVKKPFKPEELLRAVEKAVA